MKLLIIVKVSFKMKGKNSDLKWQEVLKFLSVLINHKVH